MRFSDYLYEDAHERDSTLLLTEGGKATAKWGTDRANADDIAAVISFLSKLTGFSKQFLEDHLIGSTPLTYMNKKASSGDVDIALPKHEFSVDELHKKIMFAVGDKGTFNKGTGVASYAVPGAEKDKLVQLDLMLVDNTDWAKFIYTSSHSAGSKYAGVVRNALIMAWTAHVIKPGQDVHIRNDDDETVVRASRSIHLPRGLIRLFKVRTGDGAGKTVKKVGPEEVRDMLNKMGMRSVKFDFKEDVIDDPNKVVQWLTGVTRSKAHDFMTAEQVIHQIERHVPVEERRDIFRRAKKQLRGVPKDQLPEELR